jgi:hypothetical protein
MSIPIVNTINVDYCLSKTTQINNTTSIVAIAGTRYPRNRNAAEVIWNFGDGTIITTQANNTFYNAAISHLLSAAPTFFPYWEIYLNRCIGVLIPKFEYTHTYAQPGTYKITATVVDSSGIAYAGTPETVVVKDVPLRLSAPSNWMSIEAQYPVTLDEDKIYFNSNIYPRLTASAESLSATPINATLTLNGVIGRSDIDYIKWSHGNNSYSVTEVSKSIVTSDICIHRYTYELPATTSYTPTATIYGTKNDVRFQFTITGNNITLVDRTRVVVSSAVNNTRFVNENAFVITPRTSEILPIDAVITHNVKPQLKYVIWDYNDGTFETIPVTYNSSRSNELQTLKTTHTYNSINPNPLLPSCLYLYYDSANNIITSELYKARNFLSYELGVVNPSFDSVFVKIESDTNFTKRNNISVLVKYPPTNTGQASAAIRLSFTNPKDILRYEKFIWEINGQSIIQDKNTAENFGYLEVKNIVTPFLNFNIKVQAYGLPVVMYGSGGLDLVFDGEWSYTLDIIDKDIQERANETNKRIRNFVPNYSDVIVVPPISVISPETGVTEIITPVIDITSEEAADITIPIYLNTEAIFDRLFAATNPAANFINRDFPSTASTFSRDLASRRSLGFFKPSKTSTIVVDPGIFTFTINVENVDFNKPYYFPDPFKYGSDSSVLTFSVAENSFKRGILFSKASNEPNITEDSITFYGYNSLTSLSEYEDLSYIYDKGYIHDIKSDIYGNKFGLVKDNNNFRQKVTTEISESVSTIAFNGYKFYDDVFGSGLNFDYTATGTDGYETVRTGISSNTNGFIRDNSFYYLNFKDFNYKTDTPKYPIDIATTYTNPINVGYRDGGVFMLNDTTFLANPISSDLSAFPGNNSYYFTELYEAGSNNASTLTRPLCDNTSTFTRSITANFTEELRYNGINDVVSVDCGLFITNYPVDDNILFERQRFPYIDEVDPTSLTTYISSLSTNEEDLIQRNNLSGSIFVKSYKGVQRFTEALPYLEFKYNSEIYNDLSGSVVSFDLLYDTYFIQTSSALIIDKLQYENDVFVSPRTPNCFIHYNADTYNKLSNRYKVDNNVYFTVLSAMNDNLVPFVYKFDITAHKLHQIFPITASDMTSIQDLYLYNDELYFYEASTPYISYMREGNVFNISLLLKDSNKLPLLVSMNFTETDNFVLKNITKYKFNTSSNNIGFRSTSAQQQLYTNLSSATPTFTPGNKYYIL